MLMSQKMPLSVVRQPSHITASLPLKPTSQEMLSLQPCPTTRSLEITGQADATSPIQNQIKCGKSAVFMEQVKSLLKKPMLIVKSLEKIMKNM